MDFSEARKHWYACVYDKTFSDSDSDVDFLIDIIGKEPKNILEVCCGTGRILVPLAKAKHKVTGLDMDEYMMERISEKATKMENINYFKTDALKGDWGSGYDVVVLACNIMMNIIADESNEIPQKIFIEKASKALRTGGNIYLDFNIHDDSDESKEPNNSEWVIFEGTDDRNIYGKFIMCAGGYYDKNKQMSYCNRKIELLFPDGEKNVYEYAFNKRMPKLKETIEWLNEYNLEIEQIYGNYEKGSISEKPEKVIIYAKKE